MQNKFKVNLKRKLLIIEENGKFEVVENEELLSELSQTDNVIIAEARCSSLDKIIPVGSICVFSKDFNIVNDKVVLLELEGKEYRIKHCFETDTEYVFKPNSTDKSLQPIIVDKNNTSIKIVGVLQNVYPK